MKYAYREGLEALERASQTQYLMHTRSKLQECQSCREYKRELKNDQISDRDVCVYLFAIKGAGRQNITSIKRMESLVRCTYFREIIIKSHNLRL